MKISVFTDRVTNTTNGYVIEDWEDLCDLLTDVQVGDRDGTYFVRGFCGAKRKDDTIESIDLLIIDGDSTLTDGTSCVPPELVHAVIKKEGIRHVIHTSHSNDLANNRHRWRMIIPCAGLTDKTSVIQGTREIVKLLNDNNLPVRNVGENNTVSQPWYTPRCLRENKDDFYCNIYDGEQEQYVIKGIDVSGDAQNILEEKIRDEVGSFEWEEVYDAFESGTLHQGLVSAAGWLVKTSDWADSQIKKNLTELVTRMCPDKKKVERVIKTKEIDSIIKHCREKAGQEAEIESEDVEVYDRVAEKNNVVDDLIATAPPILWEIINHYNKTAKVPQPIFALATGLIFGSVILGRRYTNAHDTYSSAYFLLIAKSGTGKDHPKHLIRMMLEECNLGWLNRADGYTAASTVLRSLAKQPLQLAFFEEMGQRLNEASKNPRSHSGGMFRQLLDVWSSCHSITKGDEYVDSAAPTVKNPALTIVGISTPREMTNAINDSLIEQGFINRILPFISDQESKPFDLAERPKVEDKIIPLSIKEWALSKWHFINNEIGLMIDASDEMKANPEDGKVFDYPFTPDAIKFLNRINHDIHAQQKVLEKKNLGDMVSRTREITMRVALIVSNMDNKAEITVDHVQWSWKLVNELYRRYVNEVKRNVAGSQIEGDRLDILAALRASGEIGIKDSELAKTAPWSRMDKRTRIELMQDLEETGLAGKVRRQQSGRGQPPIVWVALKK